MKYHDISKHDMKNGEGIRVVLWVSGCSHHCKGCHNPLTWNPKHGLEFDEKARGEIFYELATDYVSGLTLSGGDPLHEANREAVTKLAKEVKEIFPDKTIWLYTGYKFEEIPLYRLKQLSRYVDVIVDGRFEEDKKDLTLRFRGSSNQRIIDLQKTLEQNKIVLWEE